MSIQCILLLWCVSHLVNTVRLHRDYSIMLLERKIGFEPTWKGFADPAVAIPAHFLNIDTVDSRVSLVNSRMPVALRSEWEAWPVYPCKFCGDCLRNNHLNPNTFALYPSSLDARYLSSGVPTFRLWCPQSDSNWPPDAYKATALPNEL